MKVQSIVWKEDKFYIIKEIYTGVTTQGKTIEESVENLKDAISIYLEEMPQVKKELKNIKTVGAMSVEIA